MSVDTSVHGVAARVAGHLPTLGVIALISGLPVAAAAPADPQPQTVPAGSADASQPNAGASSSTLQEVVVTGTSIRGGNAQLALPVQILSAKDIARTGATSVPELMQEVSAVSSVGSTQPAQGTGFTTGGIATVSLHGLRGRSYAGAHQWLATWRPSIRRRHLAGVDIGPTLTP